MASRRLPVERLGLLKQCKVSVLGRSLTLIYLRDLNTSRNVSRRSKDPRKVKSISNQARATLFWALIRSKQPFTPN